MAIFNSNFKYHEDTVEKHPLTEEELQFLKAFQTERNTQDTVWQASPRYWVIKKTITRCPPGLPSYIVGLSRIRLNFIL